MNFLTKKFLIITAVSFASIGAGIVGTFYPAWAEAYIGDKKEETGLVGFFLDHAPGVSSYLGPCASGGNLLGGDSSLRSPPDPRLSSKRGTPPTFWPSEGPKPLRSAQRTEEELELLTSEGSD